MTVLVVQIVEDLQFNTIVLAMAISSVRQLMRMSQQLGKAVVPESTRQGYHTQTLNSGDSGA